MQNEQNKVECAPHSLATIVVYDRPMPVDWQMARAASASMVINRAAGAHKLPLMFYIFEITYKFSRTVVTRGRHRRMLWKPRKNRLILTTYNNNNKCNDFKIFQTSLIPFGMGKIYRWQNTLTHTISFIVIQFYGFKIDSLDYFD